MYSILPPHRSLRGEVGRREAISSLEGGVGQGMPREDGKKVGIRPKFEQ